jgi:DNA polymerase III epsilon subunit-like protein
MEIIASVDCETGGLNPFADSLLSISIIPVGPDFTPLAHIKPFKEFLYEPNLNVEVSALQVNKLHDYLKFQSYKECFVKFFAWCSLYKITKIMPLGQNFDAFDFIFLSILLGKEVKIFGREHRDTKIIATFLKDCGLYNGNIGLKALCENFGLPAPDHTADGDATCTHLLYAEMVKRFGVKKL